MKTCFKCEKTLPLSEFYRHPMMGDGHLGKCKDCARRDTAENRIRQIDKIRKYDRDRHKGERASRSLGYASAWAGRNKEKTKAEHAAHAAFRSGKIKKAACEYCGDKNTVMHHDDYSKPLSVRWLCPPCHKSLHAKLAGKTPWRLKHLGVA